MSRLPAQLQPLWPVVKVAHRYGARASGALSRRLPGDSVVPRRASPTASATAASEPSTATYHPAGAAYEVTRPAPSGTPSPQWWFDAIGADQVPERFVLDLAGGRAVGPHVAIVTAGGVLDVETSHYFGTRSWREHPVFLGPAPRIDDVDGTVLVLAARGTGANYYHFLVDALPRLGLVRDAGLDVDPDAYLVDTTTRYQRELLTLLGMNQDRLIEPRRRHAVRARRLLVPSLPNASTLVSRETTAWLAESLPPRRTTGLPEKLYVTRGSTPNTRRVVHEEEIVRRLTRRGFAVIDPGSLSVQDQIDHFAAARVVVGPHGAALTNLAFCRPGVRVLELFAPRYLNPGYFSITGNIAESRYRYLVADGPNPPAPGSTLSAGFMDDVVVEPDQVEQQLDQLIEGAA